MKTKAISLAKGILIAAVLFSVLVSRAQTTGGGSIRGTITDTSGAAVADAVITACNPNVAGVTTAVSDGEGHYRLTGLAPKMAR